MNWGTWIKGLAGGIIQGLATGVTTMIAFPDVAKIDNWGKILFAVGVSGIVGACLYLKQSPLPADDSSDSSKSSS